MTKEECIEKLNNDINWRWPTVQIYEKIHNIVTQYQSDNNVLDFIFPEYRTEGEILKQIEELSRDTDLQTIAHCLYDLHEFTGLYTYKEHDYLADVTDDDLRKLVNDIIMTI